MSARRTVRQNLALGMCFIVLGYFGFHAVEGRHGLESRAVLLERAATLKARLAGLEVDRLRLSRDVDLLRSDRIDPDMLAEQARRVLVMTHPDDVVVVPTTRVSAGRRSARN
ncbi:MAG: septum formation initiator family protein [Pseudomonadota bacterium]